MTTDERSADVGTRQRILQAAIALSREGGARLTVRGVAARAGVGMGTLRHHFRTQRELLDAVLSSIYEEALPDERIRDSSVPAPERLRECLGHMLMPVGLDLHAREAWTNIFRAFIAPDASLESRAGYLELHRSASHRVESWLSILVEEGALEPGDNAERAQFLVSVINGVSIQRALPSDIAPLEVEGAVLRTAISVLPFVSR